MLFRKKIPRSCSYCVRAARLNPDEMLCNIKGIVRTDKACSKFCYDPCKRIPLKRKASNFSQYDNEDFSL